MSIGRRTVIAILAAGTAVSVGVLPAAGAADGHRDHVFTIFQHDTDRQSLDFGAPGPSVGDQYVFGGDVFDHQGGTKLGRMAGHCTTSSATEILCSAAFTINGPQITFHGIVDTQRFFTGQPVDFAITGGTGPYRTARGTATGQILPPGTDALLTVRLHP